MTPPIVFHHFHSPKVEKFWQLEPNQRIYFFKKWYFVLAHFWTFWANLRSFLALFGQIIENVPNLTISMQKNWKELEKLSQNQKRQILPPKCPKTYPETKIAPKMGKGGQIWLKYITVNLIMNIGYKNNIFERCRFGMELPSALKVKAHWMCSLEIPRLCLSYHLAPNRFYQCPNIQGTFLGVKMHNSPLELGRKRAEMYVCESFKYFTKELLRKYLEKIFVILKVQFHHEGGLSQSCYFELFFSTRHEAPPLKNQLWLSPPSCFS